MEKQLTVVDAELAKLPEIQEKVLRFRYIEGLTWEKVAEKAGYSERQCRRIHQNYNAGYLKAKRSHCTPLVAELH